MAKKKNNVELEETMVTPTEEVTTPEVVDVPVVGTVANCSRLNIRKEANKSAKVVKVVDKGTTLTIDEEKSTKEWYRVKTESGVKGFCMKAYVILK